MRTPAVKVPLLACVLTLAFAVNGDAQGSVDASNLALPGAPIQTDARPSILSVRRDVQIVVQLTDPSLAVVHGKNAKNTGGKLNPVEQRAYLVQLGQKQDALLAQMRSLGGRDSAKLNKALNAVVVTINASKVPAVAALTGVRSVRPLHDYALDLSDTVPYIGAAAVQNAGVTGAGVRVAVLDTGIDYTHKFFGGAGTVSAYTAAYGTTTADLKNTTTDGLFPTAKVIGGFDFLGEKWPNAALAADPDPIDCGPSAIPAPCAGGHGTHVADIIAGNDGASHKGVAPDTKLYALKVCSSVSTSCSGVALLQAMDFALDPNGDGDISDAVDVINMSLGSSYGQIHDDLTEASQTASDLGVVVVVSAGNDSDHPYIVSSPSIAPAAISVAQTQVPSAFQNRMTIVSPAAIAGDYLAVFQSWSAPLVATIQAPVQYGNGAGGNLNGCAAFPPGSLTGKIVLVNRGTCFFSDKIRNIASAGGFAGVIALVAPGDPFDGAFGGGPAITIPGFMVSQATGNLIKSRVSTGVTARFDPGNIIPLVGSVANTSARGPSYSFNSIKPDIAAPGASVSADAGTGTKQSSFSGTSGAAPMVAGSAALLIQAHPTFSPLEIKALLMNTAETNIQTDPALQPGVLAPITRIGSGEVRVNRAFASTTAAWDAEAETPSLSFGYDTLIKPVNLGKTVEVHNYSDIARTYSLAPSFRYASDAASGAVTIDAPLDIAVPAHGSKKFQLNLKVDPAKLPIWTLNGGSRGGDGFRLQDVEFDGYITLTGGGDTIRLPWHVLPHRAAAVGFSSASKKVKLKQGGDVVLSNIDGAVPGRVDVFALLGTSGNVKEKYLPDPGDNFAIIDLKYVGARLVDSTSDPLIQFAINTNGVRSHPNYPAEFDIYIDSNRDGEFDYAVFNLENGGFAASGQNVVGVADLKNNTAGIFFFTDADLDSANAILTAPLSALGLTPSSRFDFSVFAFDNYFTGNLTDAIERMTFTPSTPRFAASGVPQTGVPAGGSSTLTIQAVAGGSTASPSQTGLLLMYRDGRVNTEADVIEVEP